jgi:hypothetical protein
MKRVASRRAAAVFLIAGAKAPFIWRFRWHD